MLYSFIYWFKHNHNAGMYLTVCVFILRSFDEFMKHKDKYDNGVNVEDGEQSRTWRNLMNSYGEDDDKLWNWEDDDETRWGGYHHDDMMLMWR